MDAAVATPTIRYNRFLPYWAVLQTDVRQTARSWVYRVWVFVMALAAGGYALFKLGAARRAGEFQPASVQTGDLLRLLVVGSLSLISLLAVSGIGSDRGSIADSVLSRGISRHQYFLAKWHSRLATILGTFIAVATVVLLVFAVAFHEAVTGGSTNLTLYGGLAGVLVIASGLAVVVSWGVSIGAMANGTVTGVTIFWLGLFGGLVIMSQLPSDYPTPERMLDELKRVLAGHYRPGQITEFCTAAGVLSIIGGAVGLFGFNRKDV
jgi:ABC-2 type transport system permease protein